MEDNLKESLIVKDIIQRNTRDGKFNLANSLIELEQRVQGLEEAMAFFSAWYNETQRANILVPNHLKDNNNSGLIL